MQHYFHAYPVSPCFSTDSPLAVMNKDGSFHVIDDTQSFPRLTSNDSGISFDTSDNESFFSDEYDAETEHTYALLPIEQQQQEEPTPTITEDGRWRLLDDRSLLFLSPSSTSFDHPWWREEVLLREYGLGLAWRICSIDHGHSVDLRYWLSLDVIRCSSLLSTSLLCLLFDEARLQCQGTIQMWPMWTLLDIDASTLFILYLEARSRRHRSSQTLCATMSALLCNSRSLVVFRSVLECVRLKRYDLLLDEICRVMKDLAWTMHKHFFPRSLESIRWDITHDGTRPVRRLFQRKGQMRAQHNPDLCEACQLGLCYP